ncbi:MAG: hypothetical protein IPL59_17400 [Candidatus Competibacteraceae bacterium]|nr:hypothetical protein [Candidatus Competibacteraceae bacterium]
MENIADVGRLAAASAKRMTQGIYRFDPDLYAARVETPLTETCPTRCCIACPNGAFYLETPGPEGYTGRPLDWRLRAPHYPRREIVIYACCWTACILKSILFPVPIRLGKGSLLDSIHAVLAAARKSRRRRYPDKLAIIEAADAVADVAGRITDSGAAAVSVNRPSRLFAPHLRIVHAQKQGPLMTPPQNVRYWTVGERIGATLRQTDTVTQIPVDPTTTHQRPRPNLRRSLAWLLGWPKGRRPPLHSGNGSRRR